MKRRMALALIAATAATPALGAAPDYAALADMGRPAKRALGFLWYTSGGVYAQLWSGYDKMAPDKFYRLHGEPVPTQLQAFERFMNELRHGSDTIDHKGEVFAQKGERLFSGYISVRDVSFQDVWGNYRQPDWPLDEAIEFHARRLIQSANEADERNKHKPWWRPHDQQGYLYA